MDHPPKTQLPTDVKLIPGEVGFSAGKASHLVDTAAQPNPLPLLQVSGNADALPGPSPSLNPVELDFAKLAAALLPALVPAALEMAEGYLELVTRPAARLGVNPQFRRKYASKALRLAIGCRDSIHDPKHEARRQLAIGQACRLLYRYELAVIAFRRAAKCRALRVEALTAMGWCQKRTGDLNGAIVSLTRALAIAPDNGRLHYNLACYLAALNQQRAALYELAWALELEPRLRPRAVVEPDFDGLRVCPAFTALTSSRTAAE